MTLNDWLLFLAGGFALSIYPGPNNLLAVTNGAREGGTRALLAGLGRIPAFALLIALTAVGLGVLLANSETFFIVLKWLGAGYLVYLGLRAMTAPDQGPPGAEGLRAPIARLFGREFLVAATNPKAIAIFAAFFPQFVAPGEPVALQFLALGLAFLLLETVAIAIYAYGGGAMARLLGSARGRRRMRLGTGFALAASGALLAMSEPPGRR
ncbi:MAG: LysE family translocator [Pseudomonadota bacterium]